MDDGRLGDEMTMDGIARQLEAIRIDLSQVKADLSHVKSELKGDIKALDAKMTIEFEDTRRVVKLAFENVQMLDEKVDRRFDESDRAHADHKTILEATVASQSRARGR